MLLPRPLLHGIASIRLQWCLIEDPLTLYRLWKLYSSQLFSQPVQLGYVIAS